MWRRRAAHPRENFGSRDRERTEKLSWMPPLLHRSEGPLAERSPKNHLRWRRRGKLTPAPDVNSGILSLGEAGCKRIFFIGRIENCEALFQAIQIGCCANRRFSRTIVVRQNVSRRNSWPLRLL